MDVSLYQAAAAMNATARWQEMIAQNLAAAPMAGGRKSDISFSDIQAGLGPDTIGPRTNYYIPTATTHANFSQGELRPSGNSMDFALEGPGFFTVQLPGQQIGYTRGGEFELNAKGQLVTTAGYLVMGAGGPIQTILGSSDPITISATGAVSQGSAQIGKLKLVDFTHPENLTVLGAGEFRADNPSAGPIDAVNTKVRQGFLEGANTSPTTQMAGLVTAMRMFEANQKVMQLDSDRMSKTISELGGTA